MYVSTSRTIAWLAIPSSRICRRFADLMLREDTAMKRLWVSMRFRKSSTWKVSPASRHWYETRSNAERVRCRELAWDVGP